MASLCLRVVLLSAAFAAMPLGAEAELDAGRIFPSAQQVAFQEETIEQRLSGWTRQTMRGTRQWLRRSYRLVANSLRIWSRWFRRASFPILIAVVFLLADPPLIAAWRRDGLQVLVQNVPLMLYVYLRLFFSPRVALLAKLLLLVAILYGVKRADLVHDRRPVVGQLDDIVLIGLATRAFVRACPEEMVERLAAQAVGWRRRVRALRRQA